MSEPVIISCTGHRPGKLGGYDGRAADALDGVARKYLLEMKPERVRSGMALGWDQAFVRAALDLGIPCTAVVPFEGQEKVWPFESRRMYKALLAKAAEVVVVSPGPYDQKKMQMQKRNEWLVDNCTILCAMYDGSYKGGTFNCVQYAHRRRRMVHNLYEDWKAALPC